MEAMQEKRGVVPVVSEHCTQSRLPLVKLVASSLLPTRGGRRKYLVSQTFDGV